MRIFVEEKSCGIMVIHPEHLRIIRPCFINDGNDKRLKLETNPPENLQCLKTTNKNIDSIFSHHHLFFCSPPASHSPGMHIHSACDASRASGSPWRWHCAARGPRWRPPGQLPRPTTAAARHGGGRSRVPCSAVVPRRVPQL